MMLCHNIWYLLHFDTFCTPPGYHVCYGHVAPAGGDLLRSLPPDVDGVQVHGVVHGRQEELDDGGVAKIRSLQKVQNEDTLTRNT